MKIYLSATLLSFLIIACAILFYNHEINNSSIIKEPDHIATLDRMEKTGVPSFKIPKLLEKGEFDLQSVKGKIVIVNFWASWCNPCVQEFPSLLQLVAKYPKDMELVALSADENKDEAIRFVKTLGVKGSNIHLLWDPEQTIGKLYGVERIPESYIVSRDGKLVRKIVGVDNWATPESFDFFESVISGETK